MGAEAVVLIVGIAASAIGALTGGIGFFAGLGITADVLLVLGLVQAVYDIFNGAVQRDKLRSAIRESALTRLKAKYAQEQMDQLEKSIPAIKAIYQAYEDLGYNKDKILEKFKDHEWLKTLKAELVVITYQTVGKDLENLDSSRHSWTDEDPQWHPMADQLDASENPHMTPTATDKVVAIMMGPFMRSSRAEVDSADMSDLPPTPDADIKIK